MHNLLMDTMWDTSFRLYPAVALALAGLLLSTRGDLLLVRGLRLPIETPGKNLTTMRGLRLALFGLALAVAAVGWAFHVPVMVAAGLVIGFEETLETSIAASALKSEFESRR